MSDDGRDIRAWLDAEAERAPRPEGLRPETVRLGRGRRIGIVAIPLLVAASVAWVAVAQPFAAAPKPKVVAPGPENEDGLIAFVTQDRNDTSPWIAVVPASGGDVIRLHEGRDPSWSPDGTRIAFGCDRGICTMNPDGTDIKQISDPPKGAYDEEPDWGPDVRILFTRTYLDQPGRGREIFMFPSESGRETKVDLGPGDWSSPAWSPDASRIAYIGAVGEGNDAPSGGFQLFVKAWGSGDQGTQITTKGAGRPQWSPDGQTILFDEGSALWLIAPSGGEPRKLPMVSGQGFDVGSFASWAPDSRRIAFMCSSTGGDNNDLCLSDVNSDDWTALVATEENEASPAWQPIVKRTDVSQDSTSGQEGDCDLNKPSRSHGTTIIFLTQDRHYLDAAYVPAERRLVAGSRKSPLKATLLELIKGTTQREKRAGCRSYFDSVGPNALRDVSLEGDELTIDFNSEDMFALGASSATSTFLEQLQRTVFRFREVNSIRLQLDGSCEAFGEAVQTLKCVTISR